MLKFYYRVCLLVLLYYLLFLNYNTLQHKIKLKHTTDVDYFTLIATFQITLTHLFARVVETTISLNICVLDYGVAKEVKLKQSRWHYRWGQAPGTGVRGTENHKQRKQFSL